VPLGGVLAGQAGAVQADAVRARVGATGARARVVVASGARAVIADASSAHVAARSACTRVALVVVPVMLVVCVPVVDVVDMVLMDDSGVTAGWTVGMGVRLGGAMVGGGHFFSSELCSNASLTIWAIWSSEIEYSISRLAF